ncbi:ATPase AAA [Petrotoga sp. 9PW.55.5.1]|jgi:hypothetical protein|uniref:ATP-binding protein n=1 Tax=Petrotoga sp. 9PW.55.5.1 TaxID=1308979 RepID=UPI000DC5B9FE|nr:ATP-binding protein [Petrotoga sp. 9PW.55.5.1]RAO99401.1 ATPase AAA [Petrotoga sp. 9PW.55.5.1]
MDFEDLHIMNPWWRDKMTIYQDRNIINYEKSNFKYYPEKLFSNIPVDKFGIYTIRGPRQVGKTTFIKLFIRKLIEDNIDPLRILFFTCDMIKDKSELADIIKIYLQSFNISKNERTYIFIDEITMVNNWQSAIKYLVDIGLIVNAVVILTGSSAYDLKVSSERMPGRRGVGKDLVFLPLTFNEYLKARGIEIDSLNLREIVSLGEEDIKGLNFRYSFLQEYFLKYINFGGFPKVIDEYMIEGKITEQTKNIYRDFILGDAEKYMNSRGIIIEIFKKLPGIIGQRFSWRSILNDLSESIKSVDTIQKYFEYLAYSFIISTIYFIDPSTKTIKFKKQKKVYPLDQVICTLITETSGKEIKMSQRIEQITLRHLLNLNKLSTYALNLYNGPYFWYSDRGNEIDFVIEENEGLFPIEVKFQNNITKSDYFSMKKVFGKGVLITKNTLAKEENIVIMPAWLFFALLI